MFAINRHGVVTRRKLSDPLAYYFARIDAQGSAVFIATNVIKRFTDAQDELLRFDASTLRMIARTVLPSGALALTSDAGHVWVATADQILRLDPRTLAVQASYHIPGAIPPPRGQSSITSLGRGPGGLWASFTNGARRSVLYRLDPITLAVRGRVEVPGVGRTQGIIQIATDPQSTWLMLDRDILRVTSSGRLSPPLRAPGLQAAAAQGRGLLALLYSGNPDETLIQLNQRATVIRRSKVGDAGARIAVDGRAVWLLHGLRLAHWTLISPQGNH
jgi:hypothetical protein